LREWTVQIKQAGCHAKLSCGLGSEHSFEARIESVLLTNRRRGKDQAASSGH
jgi:hypothetical protein